MFVEPDAVDALIRPMQAEDLEAVWRWRNQWRVRRYMFNQSEISWNEHQAWYESTCADPLKHLLIFEANGIAAGFVGFYESSSGRIADWGFYTAEGTPKGYGRLLCSSAVRFGFSSIGFHKICGRVLDYNRASLNLHGRLGFTLEGTLRDGYFDGDNYHAVHYFGLLSREYLP